MVVKSIDIEQCKKIALVYFMRSLLLFMPLVLLIAVLFYHHFKTLLFSELVNEIVKFFNLRQQTLLDPRLKAYLLSAVS